MTLSNDRLSIFWSTIRATPVLNLYYVGINFFTNQNFDSFYLLSIYTLCMISNYILKYIFKALYYIFNVSTLPILGIGKRPEGATNCGSFLVFPDKLSTTFGMPSGHSQLIWFIVIYLIQSINSKKLVLLKNQKRNIYAKHGINLSLIILALLVSYSRVEVEECHTTEQVVLGGIIGSIFAVLTFRYKNIIKTYLFK